MPKLSPFLVALVAVALLPTTTSSPALLPEIALAQSSPQKQDDAGSGGDAGNGPSQALLLPGYGPFQGSMSPHDHDWYRVKDSSSSPRCVEASFDGRIFWDVTLGARESSGVLRAHTVRAGPLHDSFRMGLAVPTYGGALFGVTPSPHPTNEGNPARPGSYAFSLAAHRTSDLPLTLNGAGGLGGGTAQVPGPCFAGRLNPLGTVNGAHHLYTFAGNAGDVVHLSLAHSGLPLVSLRLRSPDGATVGSVLRSGDQLSFELPQTGSWTLQASQFDGEGITYLIGFSREPPPTSPCRPTCGSSS